MNSSKKGERKTGIRKQSKLSIKNTAALRGYRMRKRRILIQENEYFEYLEVVCLYLVDGVEVMERRPRVTWLML